MAVTIKDVAREAGVSIATVSKIINGAPGISEATTRRVEEVMRALDYAPNSRAASLARKSARCVAFLAELDEAAPYTNPHLFDIMCGVQTALFSKGYALTLLDSLSADVEKMILSRAFDGIIVHGGALTRPIASLLIARRFPHIVIGHPSDVRLNWVDTDHTLGGRIACEHLIDCGCERLAFMGEGETAGISNQRLTGFRTALLEAGWNTAGTGCCTRTGRWPPAKARRWSCSGAASCPRASSAAATCWPMPSRWRPPSAAWPFPGTCCS